MFFTTFSITLHSPIYNITRSSTCIESFSLKERDKLKFVSNNTDLFIAFQPHMIMGSVHIIIENSDGKIEKKQCGHNTSFLITNYKSVKVKYANRGAVLLSVWQLPKGMCGSSTVYSTQQKSAVIHINQSVPTENICWFFIFRNNPAINFRLGEGNYLKLLSSKENHVIAKEYNDTQIHKKKISSQFAVVLNHFSSNFASLHFEANSSLQYGDWTDKLHTFVSIHSNTLSNFSAGSFLITDRTVEVWVIVCIISFIATIFFITAVIFFKNITFCLGTKSKIPYQKKNQ